MKIGHLIVLFAISALICNTSAQQISAGHISKEWLGKASNMQTEWYGSNEAKLIAENVLLSQRNIGGWEKNKDYHKPFTEEEKEYYLKNKNEKGGTFDNGSTITELRFLAKVYSHFKDERYKQAFVKGLNYIFMAQYKNGGWPQYFPVKDSIDEVLLDNTQPYSMHITYNDDAMVNIMLFLEDIFLENKVFGSFKINKSVKAKAKSSFNKGMECILKTQISINNKPTVWCAQHNCKTFAPANARSYELASFSGSESVGIVLLMMDIPHPSKKIIASVEGAVSWLENHKIEGVKLENEKLENGKNNRIVVQDQHAPTLWGRFCDLETGKIFFCDRDGIKKSTLAELGYNRRNGYNWYTNKPTEILQKYPEWLAKNKLIKK